MNINVRAELVAIESIQAHPQNPRLGDVAAIAESLEVNGQYSPVVVWGKTIIAGTHTWKAAKSLGWKQIAVTYFEGSEDEALRVLVTDNRTSDIAVYNNELLLDLLKSLPDLEGTGFDTEFLDELDGLHNDTSGGVSKPLVEDDPSDDLTPPVSIVLGEFRGHLDYSIHEIWLTSIKDAVGDKKAKITKEIRNRLDIPNDPKPPRSDKPRGNKTADQKMTMVETTLVPIKDLKRYPNNPREGDIGAISESLRVLGQYRPVVVNKRNNQILKGNHTVAAASALGWTDVAVVWVDVDDEQATKIVLADNRTADKATYDNDLLLATISLLDSLEGSGFDDEDVADIASGKSSTPATPKVKFQIGEYSFTTTEGSYLAWVEETEMPDGALHQLGLPLTALLREAD